MNKEPQRQRSKDSGLIPQTAESKVLGLWQFWLVSAGHRTASWSWPDCPLTATQSLRRVWARLLGLLHPNCFQALFFWVWSKFYGLSHYCLMYFFIFNPSIVNFWSLQKNNNKRTHKQRTALLGNYFVLFFITSLAKDLLDFRGKKLFQ